MVLPKFVSEVLRQSNPRALYNQQNRSESPWQGSRQRSASVKRKSDGNAASQQQQTTSQPTFASIAAGTHPAKSVIDDVTAANMRSLLSKVTENTKAMRSAIHDIQNNDTAAAFFEALFETLEMLTETQETLLAALKPASDQQSTQAKPRQEENSENMVLLGTIPKKQRFEPAAHRFQTPLVNPNLNSETTKEKPVETEQEKRLKKFRKAVEEAERSTLVTNLNLGKAKIINEETISSNVTKALIEMAAKAEGRTDGVPSPNTIERLDDIFSVAKKMKFFGKTTRSVRSKKDATINGSYCTVPIKYEFQDVGTKIYAEEVLRGTCKAQCSTPYPVILREAIRQIIDELKDQFPDNLIRVRVDTKKMVLRPSRKPKSGTWEKIAKEIKIPEDCLDVESREIPENFRIEWPTSPTRQSRKDSHQNDISLSSSSGGSQDGPP